MLEVNEYFGGKVKSIAFETAEAPATVGVMKAGEYEFGTSTVEHMTVTSGKLAVKLPNATAWKEVNAGETFVVEKDVKFKVRVDEDSSYLCLYK